MNKLKTLMHWQNLLTIVLFAQVFLPVCARAQQAEDVTIYGKGHGSIVSTVEDRNITAALVILRPDGTASITLISDLQLHVDAKWSASRSSSRDIELEITGGELSGNASGYGKLVLSDDGKSIKELMIKGKSFDGRELTLTFTADASESFRAERINLVSWPSLY